MLDLGWQELVVVACVLVLVVGPKDMPRVMKAIVTTMGKARRMAGEFQSSMMEVANQEEFRDVRKAIDDARSGRIEAFDDIRETIGDTAGSIGGSVKTRPAAKKPGKPKSGKRAVAKAKAKTKSKTKARKPAKGRARGAKTSP